MFYREDVRIKLTKKLLKIKTMKTAIEKAIDKASELLAKREDENEYHLHDVDRKWVIEAMMDYAEYCLKGTSSQTEISDGSKGSYNPLTSNSVDYQNSLNMSDKSSYIEISTNELKNICQSVIDNTPSDATEKEIGYTKAMEHIIKIIDGEPHKYSQTEISDEEIEKESRKESHLSSSSQSFIRGIKWYREQLKSK